MQDKLIPAHGPGQWNDPDMVVYRSIIGVHVIENIPQKKNIVALKYSIQAGKSILSTFLVMITRRELFPT
ncbi:hypothetical protein ANCDUO_24898 [Ancylostoma duodenale]|uniref:Uncharacterized protein n=1 Tax=Ancylostoma duodenale TaxID=51022 RepID=A0A0C2BMN1_9BILA|nr:hypothetical protein ANCDUO_24898 [Ancylostoma duodenale]